MKNMSLDDTIVFLFNRDYNEELTDEQEENLEDCFNTVVSRFGWDEAFTAIDNYMRSACLDGFAATNFALWFSFYRCSEVGEIANPYKFLGYLYYRMELDPWKYDAIDIMDGLVNDLLSTKKDKSHDPFWNPEYIPEEDPDIIAEVEKLREENA